MKTQVLKKGSLPGRHERFHVLEVTDEQTIGLFHQVLARVYDHDPGFIVPLRNLVEQVFDEETNPYFRHGILKRWVALDARGKAVGRVAAFVNYTQAYTFDQPTGGLGFFECIYDEALAFCLLDTARQWLQEQGMQAMDGPVNFGENHSWWGLQIEGDRHRSFCQNYNPPYYKRLFESYGFRQLYKQRYYRIDLRTRFYGRFVNVHHRVRQSGAYQCSNLVQLGKERFVDDLCKVYNAAWESYKGHKVLSYAQVEKMLQQFAGILDPELMWLAYCNDEPVGMCLALPEVNSILKYINKARHNAFDNALYKLLMKGGFCSRIFGFSFGVVPSHRCRGVESFLIVEAAHCIKAKGRYDSLELSWIGDFNPRMARLAERFEGSLDKVYATYRLVFSDTDSVLRKSDINFL